MSLKELMINRIYTQGWLCCSYLEKVEKVDCMRTSYQERRNVADIDRFSNYLRNLDNDEFLYTYDFIIEQMAKLD